MHIGQFCVHESMDEISRLTSASVRAQGPFGAKTYPQLQLRDLSLVTEGMKQGLHLRRDTYEGEKYQSISIWTKLLLTS